jgi:hypothetical protein
VVETRLWSTFVAGLAAFSVGYLSAVAVGGLTGRPQLFVPVVGPILGFRAASWNGGWLDFSAGLVNIAQVALIAMSVSVQVSGIGTMIGGLVARKRWLVRDAPAPRLAVVPGAGGASLGASVVGTF